MDVVIKAFLKSLFEKKARTLLVLFSISISAALVFANESFALTVSQGFYDAGVRWSGNSDLIIETQAVVGAEEWVDVEKLEGYGDIFEYVHQTIRYDALYMPSLEEMHYFTMLGVDIAEFNQRNPLTLAEGNTAAWSGNKIVIGQTYADAYDLQVGDTIQLELDNTVYDFTIAAISAPKGLFLRELADGGFILAPLDTLAQITGGESNLVFLKLKDRSQLETVKERLTGDLSAYHVRYGVNDAVISAESQTYVMPFRISSVVVVFMCVFIIFTAFNLITLERIPIVGTLRSIGATRRRINTYLIAESILLGVAGGLIGCVLGVGVLYYIKETYSAGEDLVMNARVIFGLREVLIATGAAVIVTLASAVMPILRMTGTPIKNIILNDLGKQRGKPSLWWIAGLVLIVACPLAQPFIPHNFTGMIIAGVLSTGALIGLVPLIPFLTWHLSRLIAMIPGLSQEVVLGVRNIRDNRNLINNIQLFAASLAIVAFMASIFGTMGADLIKAWERDTRYDISMVLRHSDPASLERLAGVKGVTGFAGSYQQHAPIPDYKMFLNILYGIESADFFNYQAVGDLAANQEALAGLNDGKHIILTHVLKEKLGIRLGDTLNLQFGSRTVGYTVTGFVETNMGIGHVGFISADNYRAEMGVVDYDSLFVSVQGDPEAVKTNILRALGKEVMRIDTRQELMTANADKVVGIFKAIESYGQLALLVGIIGIVNNLAASFIERKRSFAMLRCVGMSKQSLNRMLISEAVAMGVFGVAFGLTCALVMSASIPATVSVMWGNVSVQIAWSQMAIMGVVGILAMLVISAVPVMSNDKLSLIQTIKYE